MRTGQPRPDASLDIPAQDLFEFDPIVRGPFFPGPNADPLQPLPLRETKFA